MTHRLRLACLLLGTLHALPGQCCTVNSGTLAFGSINPLKGSGTYSTATITVSCPSTTGYSIALGPGNGTVADRRMSNGSHTLDYNLYTDVTQTEIWGDGTAGTATVSGSANASGTQHTVYGVVPPQPRAWPGAYLDTVVVTVSY